MANRLGNPPPLVPGQGGQVVANPPNSPDQQPEHRPRLRNRSGADTSADVSQWLHDARALDRKFSDLITKLDALMFALDCCLSNISSRDVFRKLASESKKLLDSASSTKRSFVSIQGAIKGARIALGSLPDSQEKTQLRKCVEKAEQALKSFSIQSIPEDSSEFVSGETLEDSSSSE